MRLWPILFLAFFIFACQSEVTESPTPTVAVEVIAPTSILIPTETVEQPTEQLPTPTKLSPTEDISLSTPAVSKRFDELLAFLPVTWADMHLPVDFGPTIYLLDMVQMREDLQIFSITGEDSRQDKLDLILGLDTQGFPLAPTQTIDPLGGGMFMEWGWDIADVAQMMSLPDFKTTLYRGNFERPEIREWLLEKGYSSTTLNDFDYFNKEGDVLEFALTSDTLIMSIWEEESFIALMLEIKSIAPGLETHPAVQSILAEMIGGWGVALSPSPDVVTAYASFNESLANLPPAVQERFKDFEVGPVSWNFMGITFKPQDDKILLTFLYHYPSEKEAMGDIEVVEQSFVDAPALSFSNTTWGDLIELENVKVQGELLIVDVTTSVDDVIGNAIERRDAMGFLLLKQP